MLTVKDQSAQAMWNDEKGIAIPSNRVTKAEKFKEKASTGVAKKALKLSEDLIAFKTACKEACEKAYQKDLEAGKASTKGGYTLYNFDKSVKIERTMNEAITFDENIIGAAKEKFDEFLTAGTQGIDEMVRALIMDAFSSTRKGKLDSKKIMSLLSYKERINEKKYPAFHEALRLIEESIRRPDSKTYYRIWIKDNTNEYQNIDLNFSSI